MTYSAHECQQAISWQVIDNHPCCIPITGLPENQAARLVGTRATWGPKSLSRVNRQVTTLLEEPPRFLTTTFLAPSNWSISSDAMFVPPLSLGVLAFSLCARSLCDKRPGPEFPGKHSLQGISGEELNVTSLPVDVDARPFVAAPSVRNGPSRAHNWTASMLGPQHMVSKRAPDPLPRRYGPLWSQGNNCVFCPEQELLEQDALRLFYQLKPDKMKTYMRGTPADLYNKCVFYTKAEDRNTALASPATDWACLHNKYTAWVSWHSFQIPMTFMLLRQRLLISHLTRIHSTCGPINAWRSRTPMFVTSTAPTNQATYVSDPESFMSPPAP